MMERQGGKVGHDRDKVFKRKKMTRSSRKKKKKKARRGGNLQERQ